MEAVRRNVGLRERVAAVDLFFRAHVERPQAADSESRQAEAQALGDALSMLLAGAPRRRPSVPAEAAPRAAGGAGARVVVALHIRPVYPLLTPVHLANMRGALVRCFVPARAKPRRQRPPPPLPVPAAPLPRPVP